MSDQEEKETDEQEQPTRMTRIREGFWSAVSWLQDWPYTRSAVIILVVTAAMVFVVIKLPASVRWWSLIILIPIWLYIIWRQWRFGFERSLGNKPRKASLRHDLGIARMLEKAEDDTVLYRYREQHGIVLLSKLPKPVLILVIILVLSMLIPEPTEPKTGTVLVVLVLVGAAWLAKRAHAAERYGFQLVLIAFGIGFLGLLLQVWTGTLWAPKLLAISLSVYWIVLYAERWRKSYLVLDKSGIYTEHEYHWTFGKGGSDGAAAQDLASVSYDDPGGILEELFGLECGELTIETHLQKDTWLHNRRYTPHHRWLAEVVRQLNEKKG